MTDHTDLIKRLRHGAKKLVIDRHLNIQAADALSAQAARIAELEAIVEAMNELTEDMPHTNLSELVKIHLLRQRAKRCLHEQSEVGEEN